MAIRRRALCLAALGSCLVASAALPARSAAQTVILRVLSAESSEPIFGALAYLIDDAGQVVRTVLTDERGRALFVRVPPARYRARAEMIGMATQDTEAFGVSGSATEPREIRLEPRPIDLETIDVTAERRRCTARPAGEGVLLADLWDEARKALSAAALTDRQGFYRYETMRYERDVDRGGIIVLREEEARREGYMRAPFVSPPPEELLELGFARSDGAEQVYHAPDARVLLSDVFLDTHCFRVVPGDEGSGLVGLGFEPVGDRGLPDIAGTLWLDDRTAELRWLDYSYWNLGLAVGSAEAGGHVEFRRMPNGAWIVPEWWIRMPLFESRILPNRSARPALVGSRQAGGRVLQVHEGGGRSLAGGRQTGGIEGTVVDSAGLPLSGARVGVVGSSQDVFTDTEGRFGIVGVAPGAHQVRFVDPRLAPLGLAPAPVDRDVIAGEMSSLEFLMPSGEELMLEACADRVGPGTSVVAGRVVDAATGQPLAGATVRITAPVGAAFEATVSASGAYLACSVPRGVPLQIVSVVNGVEHLADTLTIGPDEPTSVHEIRRPPR